jgi:predicted transcriptional regulator of viral defense system
MEPVSNLDILTVVSRIPRAVVCLISALAYHGITTQIPRKVYIALEKGAETPRISYPPIAVHRYSHESFTAGVEKDELNGVIVRIYSLEKTLADCFKFRNKIGMDVFLEALKMYRARRKFKLDDLLTYARICRVEKQMKPYLETIL